MPIITEGSVFECDARLLLEGAATLSAKRRPIGIELGAIVLARGETTSYFGRIYSGQVRGRLNEAERGILMLLGGNQSQVQVARP